MQTENHLPKLTDIERKVQKGNKYFTAFHYELIPFSVLEEIRM